MIMSQVGRLQYALWSFWQILAVPFYVLVRVTLIAAIVHKIQCSHCPHSLAILLPPRESISNANRRWKSPPNKSFCIALRKVDFYFTCIKLLFLLLCSSHDLGLLYRGLCGLLNSASGNQLGGMETYEYTGEAGEIPVPGEPGDAPLPGELERGDSNAGD